MPSSNLCDSDFFIPMQFHVSPEDQETFNSHCRSAILFFRNHPHVQKISKNKWQTILPSKTQFSWSFLNTGENGIYVFSDSMVGSGAFGRVKYALRIDDQGTDLKINRLFTVKIQKALFVDDAESEARIGLAMGFFTQGLFIRYKDLPVIDNGFKHFIRHKSYLIGPYKGINLFTWLKIQPSAEQREIVAVRACLAVYDAHKKNIFHGDIKLENFLIDPATLKVTLSDFGHSSDFSMGSKLKFGGTQIYLPWKDDIHKTMRFVRWPEQPYRLDFFALRRVLFMPNMPSLLNEEMYRVLPSNLQQILRTLPIDESSYFLNVDIAELAGRLILFLSKKRQSSSEDWVRICEAYISNITYTSPHYPVTEKNIDHIHSLLQKENFIRVFSIQNKDAFLEVVRAACNYFSCHPGEKKLSRKYLGNNSGSFLKFQDAIYIISRHRPGDGRSKSVKYAMRIDQPGQFLIVKIKKSPKIRAYGNEQDINQRRHSWRNELNMGKIVGFFPQNQLFLREAVRDKLGKCRVDKSYMFSTYSGEELCDWILKGPSSQRRLWVAFNLFVALIDLHRKKVVHNKLEPTNIVVNSLGEVTIVDFSRASKASADGVGYLPEPRNYYAPVDYPADANAVKQAAIYTKEMGQVFTELFALKRIIRMPFLTDNLIQYSLIDDETFQCFPTELKNMFDTSNPGNVYQRRDSLQEMAARLVLFMFKLKAPPFIDEQAQTKILDAARHSFIAAAQDKSGLDIISEEQLRSFVEELQPADNQLSPISVLSLSFSEGRVHRSNFFGSVRYSTDYVDIPPVRRATI